MSKLKILLVQDGVSAQVYRQTDADLEDC